MEKSKRNKIVGLSVGILIVLIIVVSSTYAYWQITKTQATPNDIVAACLSLDLEDVSAAIDLDSAWPINDEEASNLTGYTFTVTNNCNEEINYIVGLNRVEESNYLQDSSVKVRLDDNSSFIYGDLSDIEYADSENAYTSRVSKQVSVETIGALSTNEHTIRIWIDENAPVTEQSKTFEGQVFITGGQGIEVPECFTIAENGTITGYNYECGTEVVVPAEINGIQVKTISQPSFAMGNVQGYSLYNEETDESKGIYYYIGKTGVEDFINSIKQNFCENPETCTLEDIEAMGMTIITTKEEYNAIDWEEYETNGYVVDGPYAVYFNFETGEMEKAKAALSSLDLSKSIYLETIEESSFNGKYESDTIVDNTCIENNDSGKAYICYGTLKKVSLPNNGSLTSIGSYAFANNQLQEVVIPQSVESIGYSAFYNNNITSFIIKDTVENPSNLKSIGSQGLANNAITELVIPRSVTTIGANAFGNCPVKLEVIIKREAYDKDTMNFDPNWNVISISADGTKILSGVTYDPDYVG